MGFRFLSDMDRAPTFTRHARELPGSPPVRREDPSPYYGPMVIPSKASTGPIFVTPMAAKSAAELPHGDGWIYELKPDGSSYSS